jgi:hypothetical protein
MNFQKKNPKISPVKKSLMHTLSTQIDPQAPTICSTVTICPTSKFTLMTMSFSYYEHGVLMEEFASVFVTFMHVLKITGSEPNHGNTSAYVLSARSDLKWKQNVARISLHQSHQ